MTCCLPPPEPGSLDPLRDAILGRISAFAMLLRNHGFIIGLRENTDAARLAGELAIERPATQRAAFKALFCSRASDWRQFDELFNSYWFGRGMKKLMKVAGSGATSTRPNPSTPTEKGSNQTSSSELSDQVSNPSGVKTEEGSTAKSEGASRTEITSSTDFRKIADPRELEKAHAAAERLARAMRARLTRRERARKRGRRIDLRATIRRNIGVGGTPIDLRFRQRKPKPLRLIVLLDASGSMQMYTAVFIRFIHGILDNFREAEAFVFHTRLAHISSAMKEKNAARAGTHVSHDPGRGRRNPDWRLPCNFQQMACQARFEFAQLRDDPVRRL